MTGADGSDGAYRSNGGADSIRVLDPLAGRWLVTIPKQPAFGADEFERRREAVRAAMEAEGVDVLVTFSPHNVFYLTGMDSENLFDYQCALLSLDRDEASLLIFEFELARAANSVMVDDVRSYGTFDDPIAFTLEQLAGLAGKRIALDRNTLSVERYGRLVAGLDRLDVSDAFGLVEGARLVKSDAELRLMERAAALTDAGVEAATGVVGEGVEDRVVAAAIVDAMYRAGSDTLCWGPIVAAGYRAGAAHSTFNGHRIGRGETVFLELTGEVSRYVSPLMRTVVAGEPSADMLRVEEAVTGALESIRTNARPGASARDVAAGGLAALEGVLEGHVFHHYFGYPVGIGYPPTWIESLGFFIRADNDRPLERGMTFHLPMSIRKYGEYGVNLSHTLVVEDGGARILGSSPARLAVV